jgi:hypothetical protein
LPNLLDNVIGDFQRFGRFHLRLPCAEVRKPNNAGTRRELQEKTAASGKYFHVVFLQILDISQYDIVIPRGYNLP